MRCASRPTKVHGQNCFDRDTIEYTSREKDESKPGIKTRLPFLKNITEENDLENFQALVVDA